MLDPGSTYPDAGSLGPVGGCMALGCTCRPGLGRKSTASHKSGAAVSIFWRSRSRVAAAIQRELALHLAIATVVRVWAGQDFDEAAFVFQQGDWPHDYQEYFY